MKTLYVYVKCEKITPLNLVFATSNVKKSCKQLDVLSAKAERGLPPVRERERERERERFTDV